MQLLPATRYVGFYLLVEEVVPTIGEGCEVLFGRHVSATQWFAVSDFLDVAQAAGDTFVAVGVEGIERD